MIAGIPDSVVLIAACVLVGVVAVRLVRAAEQLWYIWRWHKQERRR